MLRLLLRLRFLLPGVVFRRLLAAYWQWFWRREEKIEEQKLDRESQSAIRGSERAVLIEEVASHYPFASLLEVGSGFGQNFDILAKIFPGVKFVGIDADAQRVRGSEKFLSSQGVRNVQLVEGRAEDLSDFPDTCADIVLSSAMMLFISSESIEQVISEMIRVAKKRVILLEQHVENTGVDSPHLGVRVPKDTGRSSYWLRNYQQLLEQFVSPEQIELINIPNPRWEIEQWKKYAQVLSVRL